MGHAILRDIIIIFAVSVPVVLVAHRLRFPSIVGFLVTGVIIGPHALGLIPDIKEIQVLAEVGVALLLFSIGLEFSFERLKGWGQTALGMGAVQVVLTAAAGMALGFFSGRGTLQSAFLGCAIALSSTAIVLAILSQKRWYDALPGRISTGILLFQDLAVIPMVVVLQFFAGMTAEAPLTKLAWAGVNVAGLILVLYVLSRWVLKPILLYIAAPRSKELFVVVVVGIAISAAYATQSMGLSFALGAFLAGILMSTTEFRFHALSEIAPFRYCFNGLFFVALGMIVNPSFVINHIGEVALLVAFILVVKMAIVGGTIVAFGYPLNVAAIGAMMLAQVGEFSFMLVFLGYEAGAIGKVFYHLVVDAAAITMIIAPFIVTLAPKIGEKIAPVSWRLWASKRRERDPECEGACLEGHAIICGFGPLGMTIGHLMDQKGVPYVVLELNPFARAKVKGRGRIYIGDGASADLLNHVGIDKARLLAIAVPDHLNAFAILKQARLMNPDIFIVIRSRYRDQVEGFYDAGADVVVCEELEAGIEMGRYILEHLGFVGEDVEEVLSEIRAFGSADFF